MIKCAVSRTHTAPLRSQTVQIHPRLSCSKRATHACWANKFAYKRKSEIKFVKHTIVLCAFRLWCITLRWRLTGECTWPQSTEFKNWNMELANIAVLTVWGGGKVGLGKYVTLFRWWTCWAYSELAFGLVVDMLSTFWGSVWVNGGHVEHALS